MEITEEDANQLYEKGYEGRKQEEQENISSDAQYAIYQQQQQEMFNIYRLKSEDWIEKISREFAGEIPEIKKGDDGEPIFTGRWIRSREITPLLNREGASLLKTTFLNYANKGSYLAFLRIEDIRRVCLNLKIDLATALGFYYKKYGVPLHMRRMVINNIINKIYIELTRAIKGREADLISKSYSYVQHESYGGTKPGMMGRLKGWLSPRR